MVVSLTAAKFKPLIFSVRDLAFSYEKISISMNLYDGCLLLL